MHDPASHAHTPARAEVTLAPSLLRLSVWQRLGFAAGLALVLWLAVAWALMERAP